MGPLNRFHVKSEVNTGTIITFLLFKKENQVPKKNTEKKFLSWFKSLTFSQVDEN
jgi:hypothetical protein